MDVRGGNGKKNRSYKIIRLTQVRPVGKKETADKTNLLRGTHSWAGPGHQGMGGKNGKDPNECGGAKGGGKEIEKGKLNKVGKRCGCWGAARSGASEAMRVEKWMKGKPDYI